MMERFMRLLDDLHQKVSLMPSFRWAVVESVSPLRIRYETEAAPVAGTPDTLVAGLQVGDRVWCMRIYRRDIILGRGKGSPQVGVQQTVRTTSDSITATAALEFNITSSSPFQVAVEEPTWYRFTYQAWKGGTAELRAGIDLSGATVDPYNAPTWGAVIRSLAEGNVSVEKVALLSPGVTTVKVMGHKVGSANPGVSYQILTAYPVG